MSVSDCNLDARLYFTSLVVVSQCLALHQKVNALYSYHGLYFYFSFQQFFYVTHWLTICYIHLCYSHLFLYTRVYPQYMLVYIQENCLSEWNQIVGYIEGKRDALSGTERKMRWECREMHTNPTTRIGCSHAILATSDSIQSGK